MVDIKRAIPHRAPFLFVDRVHEIHENAIVASKIVSPDLDFFKGHYPDFPLMPGVLVCESIFQAGAILLAQRLGEAGRGVPVLTRIRDARFKKMVRPGDTLFLRARIEEVLSSAFYMKGSASVEGKKAVSVDFTCALAPLSVENES